MDKAGPPEGGVGPLLFFRGLADARARLAALAVLPDGVADPVLEADGAQVDPEILMRRDGWRILRYRFALPVGGLSSYRYDGVEIPVSLVFDAPGPRIAYVSCNGQEEGDLDREPGRRNRLWHRLARENEARPFGLLLQGGDQIYADEVLEAHPAVRAWAHESRVAPVDAATLAAAEDAMESAFLHRYLILFGQDGPSKVMARIPSLAMWDDHDICDGWGSLRERKLDAPIGRALFRAARRFFLLFQMAATPEDLPEFCTDPEGGSLGWRVHLPGLSLIAPDLRSERRPRRVMGEAGWRGFDAAMAEAASTGQGSTGQGSTGQGPTGLDPTEYGTSEGARRILILSSVPALGPRLSWVEAMMVLMPSMQKYEDDLRDQWQSRYHRAEWRRFLQAMLARHGSDGCRVTVLSGEIHLATRGHLETPAGPIHQLVASGITHPTPPAGYARGLGLLSRLGSSPLPGHPIRLRPLPGKRAVYTAERNYLTIEPGVSAGSWRCAWELEESGRTPDLTLD
ncbi:alkaline phosphatase family protein [Marivibrio halodurans]|uniref:Alkaline phosphatase family protein n=1 Tax=Marivibrio halodurans TaxID=2039722 RepID=A0A8J7S5L4_9PROT|nr:alkaline phosphatase D family protein [Marivibrio halodurans]MBP5855997.1 alkaline phosphatase family protein [Marivibrio halodurans]